MYPGIVANVIATVAVALLPLWLLSFLPKSERAPTLPVLSPARGGGLVATGVSQWNSALAWKQKPPSGGDTLRVAPY